ncbi:AAA family ATPase, partial [Streptomyces sp. TRM76130]|nr:AAA family ATPase [Streptomyces sp. TRM76130]
MSTPVHDDPLSDPLSHPLSGPLARERAHLAASRAALRAMRADVESLDIGDVTANWVNAAVLKRQIEDRVKALADLGDTPLFFGRLDYAHAPGAEEAERSEGERPRPEATYRTLHIGR